MLSLFTLDEDWRVIIRPETLKLTPFKNVMDKYKNREDGITELSYVYIMADWETDYDELVDLKERSEKIMESLAESYKIKLDNITVEAINFYKERQPSISLHHLDTVKIVLANLQEAMINIDMTKTIIDEEGEEVELYDTLALNRITSIIEKSPKLIAAVKEMEKQVRTEIQENTSHVGSGQKSIYEDG